MPMCPCFDVFIKAVFYTFFGLELVHRPPACSLSVSVSVRTVRVASIYLYVYPFALL